MSNSVFKIPVNDEELLNGDCGGDWVGEVLTVQESCKKIKVAQDDYRDMGSVFIVDHFGTYYSVAHNHLQMPRVVVFQAFEDLRKSLNALVGVLNLHVEEAGEGDIDGQVKQEIQNIINMSIYLLVTLFGCLEKSNYDTDSFLANAAAKRGTKTKKKPDAVQADTKLAVKWSETVKVFVNLMQLDLHKFWDSAGVEDVLLHKVLEMCFMMLEEARIKQDKDAQTAIWTLFGILLIYYDTDNLLLMRLGRFVKEYEYSVQLLGDGVPQIVNVFGARSFIEKLTRELTEWQLQETNVESSATKNCSRMVVELATQLPMLMEAHLDYLEQYLRCDNYQLRLMAIGVQVIIMQEGMQHMGSLPEPDVARWRTLRDTVLQGMLIMAHDRVGCVRARIFSHVEDLVRTGQMPPALHIQFLQKATQHLRDITCPVRKAAAACITAILKFNLLGPKLSYAKVSKELKERQNELVKLKYEIFQLDFEEQKTLEKEWETHVPGLRKELTRLLTPQPVVVNADDASNDEDDSQDDDEAPMATEGGQDGKQPQEKSASAEAEAAPPDPLETSDTVQEQIRAAIHAKNYVKAVELCTKETTVFKSMKAMRDRMREVSDTIYYIMYLRVVFSNLCVAQPPPEQIAELTKLEASVEYLTDAGKFIQMLNEAMSIMCELLNSTNISDMHVAVEFIMTSKSFHLDDATVGINSLLKVMLRIEEDRRKIAGNALRGVFLTTDSKHLADHANQVSENLIAHYQNMSASCKGALERLIAVWSTDGTLSNDIIDALWSHFLMRVPTTMRGARAALGILRMATKGRHSVIARNFNVVASVCFGERGRGDPLLVKEGLDILYTLSDAPFGATHDSPAFRVPANDAMWRDLGLLLQHYRDGHVPSSTNIVSSVVRLIFALHVQPFKYISFIIRACGQRPAKGERCMRSKSNLITYYLLIGEIAQATLRYLDVHIYLELKRRQHLRDLKKLNAAGKKGKKKGGSKTPGIADRTLDESMMNASSASKRNRTILNNTLQSLADDTNTEMVGAEAMDEDADFIAHVLEHSLDENTTMGKLLKRVVWACRSPACLDNELLQVSAATALARGMLVSSDFCTKNVQMLFKILMKTKFVHVKTAILVHMVDLLERFPNIVEPYTPMLYPLLDDTQPQTRRVALNTIGMLILKDMIRPQGDIWRLAVCLVDDEEAVCKAARSFFLQSTDKSNTLYNYLPDIFSHLCERYRYDKDKDISTETATNDENVAPNEQNVPEKDPPPLTAGSSDFSIASTSSIKVKDDREDYRFTIILDYLFSLIDKNKHIEILVERFCLKFDNTDEVTARRIAYALSLMPYHDRALQKLIENFPRYRHFVLVNEVSAWFGALTAGLKNKALKPLAKELDDLIQEMFKVDGRPRRPLPKKDAPPKKRAAAKGGKRRGRKSRVVESSSDGE